MHEGCACSFIKSASIKVRSACKYAGYHDLISVGDVFFQQKKNVGVKKRNRMVRFRKFISCLRIEFWTLKLLAHFKNLKSDFWMI